MKVARYLAKAHTEWGMLYARSESGLTWTQDKQKAFVFPSELSANRVAAILAKREDGLALVEKI